MPGGLKRKRALTALLLAVVTATAASACGDSGGSSGGGDGGTTTLSLWTRDSQKGFIDEVVDKFNSTHKDVQVKTTIIPTANYVQKFGTAVASGSGPDVASIDLVFLPYFASQNALDDITDKAKALDYFDDLSPAHVKLATYEDKIYALPFTGDASALFWNKDLFKKAGLDPNKPPKNWADIEAAATKVNALGDDTYGFYFSGQCGGCNIFTLAPLIWASGGALLTEDGQPTFDAPEVTEALQFYRDMWTKGLIPSSAKGDNGTNFAGPFMSGNAAMVGAGAFQANVLLQQKRKINFGVTPLPGKTGGESSFAGGDEIAIPSTSENKEAAWTFVEWAAGEEAQKLLASKDVAPIRQDVLDSSYASKGSAYEVLGKALWIGQTANSVAENALINDNNSPWVNMIQQAVFGGDIEGAQQAAQQRAEQIVAEATG